MTAIHAPAAGPHGRTDFERWRRRSRLIRILRIVLPALIALIFLALVGSVAWSTFRAQPRQAATQNEPIRIVAPRFVGRDDKGRAYVLTAVSATRDPKDYQRVVLDKPALVMDEGGPDEMRLRGTSGVFRDDTRRLQLTDGVRMSDPRNAFETAASEFDGKTGELIGSGPIQGAGALGEVQARSYGVYDKGERLVFKGGVHTRLTPKAKQ